MRELTTALFIFFTFHSTVEAKVSPEKTTTLWNSVGKGLQYTISCKWKSISKDLYKLERCYSFTFLSYITHGISKKDDYQIISDKEITYSRKSCNVFAGDEVIGTWNKCYSHKIINKGITINENFILIDEENKTITID